MAPQSKELSSRLLASSRTQEIKTFVDLLGTALLPRSALYVSVPITTGPIEVEWRARSARDISYRHSEDEFRKKVIEPNRARAGRFVEHLRSMEQGVVVDPSSFPDIKGWNQDDYRVLWARVIEVFAARCAFLDGWEYSNGCAFEFLTATRLGLPMITQSGQPLKVSVGTELLRSAMMAKKEGGLDVSFLCRVVEWLDGDAITGERKQKRGVGR